MNQQNKKFSYMKNKVSYKEMQKCRKLSEFCPDKEGVKTDEQ